MWVGLKGLTLFLFRAGGAAGSSGEEAEDDVGDRGDKGFVEGADGLAERRGQDVDEGVVEGEDDQ